MDQRSSLLDQRVLFQTMLLGRMHAEDAWGGGFREILEQPLQCGPIQIVWNETLGQRTIPQRMRIFVVFNIP